MLLGAPPPVPLNAPATSASAAPAEPPVTVARVVAPAVVAEPLNEAPTQPAASRPAQPVAVRPQPAHPTPLAAAPVSAPAAARDGGAVVTALPPAMDSHYSRRLADQNVPPARDPLSERAPFPVAPPQQSAGVWGGVEQHFRARLAEQNAVSSTSSSSRRTVAGYPDAVPEPRGNFALVEEHYRHRLAEFRATVAPQYAQVPE
ncbi:MAG TPA: hypothetical protein VK196_14020 [Magnetospirillum sp.]|nr:hypothetical protein [Magnetospirillum sp.]